MATTTSTTTTAPPHHEELEKQVSSKNSSEHDHPVEKPQHETPYEAAADAEAGEVPGAQQPPSFANVPDGGLQAWLQVLCSWFLFFNTWSVLCHCVDIVMLTDVPGVS